MEKIDKWFLKEKPFLKKTIFLERRVGESTSVYREKDIDCLYSLVLCMTHNALPKFSCTNIKVLCVCLKSIPETKMMSSSSGNSLHILTRKEKYDKNGKASSKKQLPFSEP